MGIIEIVEKLKRVAEINDLLAIAGRKSEIRQAESDVLRNINLTEVTDLSDLEKVAADVAKLNKVLSNRTVEALAAEKIALQSEIEAANEQWRAPEGNDVPEAETNEA